MLHTVTHLSPQAERMWEVLICPRLPHLLLMLSVFQSKQVLPPDQDLYNRLKNLADLTPKSGPFPHTVQSNPDPSPPTHTHSKRGLFSWILSFIPFITAIPVFPRFTGDKQEMLCVVCLVAGLLEQSWRLGGCGRGGCLELAFCTIPKDIISPI